MGFITSLATRISKLPSAGRQSIGVYESLHDLLGGTINYLLDQVAGNSASIAAFNQIVSASSGNFSSSDAAYVDITNMSVTITTNGRPVDINFVWGGSAGSASFTKGGAAGTALQLLRDSTEIAIWGIANTVSFPTCGFSQTDVVAAGTYVYKLQINPSGSASVFKNTKMQVTQK